MSCIDELLNKYHELEAEYNRVSKTDLLDKDNKLKRELATLECVCIDSYLKLLEEDIRGYGDNTADYLIRHKSLYAKTTKDDVKPYTYDELVGMTHDAYEDSNAIKNKINDTLSKSMRLLYEKEANVATNYWIILMRRQSLYSVEKDVLGLKLTVLPKA